MTNWYIYPIYTYSWIPQGHIIVSTKGEHARLNVPVRGGWMPVPPSTDIVGCNGHHEDHASGEKLRSCLL